MKEGLGTKATEQTKNQNRPNIMNTIHATLHSFMKSKSSLRARALVGSIAALLAVPAAQAAVVNWDGDTSVAWSNAANWNALPTDDLFTDIANFNQATYGFAPDAGMTSINGITIGASNGPMTLTTTSLSIGTGGITIANLAGALTVAGGVTIGGIQSWANNSSTALTTGGILAIDNQLSLTAGTFALGNFANTGAGGVVINGATAQAGNDAAFGTGTLTLTSGTVSSDGGTARSFANALAINGSVTLGDATNNGALAFTGGTTITGSNTITLAGSGGATFSTAAMSLADGSNTTFSSASGALTLSGGFNTNTGTKTLTFDTGANAVTMSGALTGSGTLVLAGSGTNVTVGALTTTANAIQVNSTTDNSSSRLFQ